jgi:lactoylglutathione lyase
MSSHATSTHNVQQAVPFFLVSNIEASTRWYVEGLGFEKTLEWTPGGVLRWCWLKLGGAAVMLQELRTEGHGSRAPLANPGEGVSIHFICADALAIYREVTARGIRASRPFVGNGMWVTSLKDPDGYELHFESLTDVPEETVLADAEG